MSITGDSYKPQPKAAVDGLLVTGDCTKNKVEKVDGVMFVNFPTAHHKNLEQGSDPINRHSVSGKQLGSAVIGYTYKGTIVEQAELLFASGKKEVAGWVNAKSLVGSDARDVTPNAVRVNTSVIGDQPAIHDTEYEGVTFVSFDTVKAGEINNTKHSINQKSFSGKKAGALVLVENTAGTQVALYAASDESPAAPWKRLVLLSTTGTDLAATITPTTPPTIKNTIGDCTQRMESKSGVYLHALPDYPKEDGFLSATSVINNTRKSGKRLGSMCIIRDGSTSTGLYMANGDKPTSHWVCLVALKGAAVDLVPTA